MPSPQTALSLPTAPVDRSQPGPTRPQRIAGEILARLQEAATSAAYSRLIADHEDEIDALRESHPSLYQTVEEARIAAFTRTSQASAR